ncbi:tyrosine--tRNA ligase [Candidatus Microgenomates bacterium]|nr:tyrosine--tRNA ligase [Candidatus Microgenomates bacterium]
MIKNKTDNSIESVLTRGVEQVLPGKKALASLMTKRKIKLYQGFDPSAPSLHLGNFVGLMKLRAFQKLGHKVIFLVGDFTGMIGDPTDKLATRTKLTREQVLENAKAWKKQVGLVLDTKGTNPVEFIFNSSWNDKVSFKDLIEITSNITHSQMIERDMFRERIKNNKDIWFHELLYPIAQGYDSVHMEVDLEVGGNDQLFNMIVGRKLLKAMKGKEKFVMTTKLLVDKDGNKVGKTTGNALFLDSTPNDFYAGIMSFPDEVIYLGFELLTEVDLTGLKEQIRTDPMKLKKQLAFGVVSFLWGKEKASKASGAFEKTFQKGGIPKDIKIIKVADKTLPLLDLVFASKLVSSRSEAKRLIKQNAIDVNLKTVTNTTKEIEIGKKGVVLRIGKTKFVKLQTK